MTNDTANEQGVPNWEDKEAYPASDDAMSLNAWRWEFLRRDDGYRNAWGNRKEGSYPDWEYGLVSWLDPSKKLAPVFQRPCHEVLFDQKDPREQRFHYMALRDARPLGSLVFSVDINTAIEPQLDAIRDAYTKAVNFHVHPDDRQEKAPRKNNSSSKSKSRSRGFMLRLLDADGAGASVSDFLDHIALEEIDLSEAATRRTLAFAKGFWKRL